MQSSLPWPLPVSLRPRPFGASLPGVARKRRHEEIVGRRFEHGSVVWEVARISYAPNTVPHVELFKVRDPTERKTIAVSALIDGDDFVPIEEQS